MADIRAATAPQPALPWSRESGENRRFGIILLLVLMLFLPPAMLIPALDLPEPERSEVERIPPRLARLLQQPAPLEKPEPQTPEPEPRPAPQPEPKPRAKPEPEPKPEPELQQSREPDSPRSEPAPQQPSTPVQTAQTVQQAREKAARSGLLAMKDRLASLRAPEPEPKADLQANIPAVAPSSTDAVTAKRQVLAGSGGIADQTIAQARAAVAAHDVKAVAEPDEPSSVVAQRAPEPATGERAMSNIRKVFAAQKTALYALYRRELRQDPTLEGKVLLELVIEPDGSVSACTVVSSELDHPTLEQRIAMRVRLFNFGADKVEARRVRFPIDFLPG